MYSRKEDCVFSIERCEVNKVKEHIKIIKKIFSTLTEKARERDRKMKLIE